MHETALMESMLTIAAEHLAPYQVGRVTNITLRVGRLANVLPDALSFAFSAMTHDGIFDGARLTLNFTPYAARCRDCAAIYESTELPPACPNCGGHGVELLSGTEVSLESIDFDEQG